MEDTAQNKANLVSLRIPPPSIAENGWPCHEDKLGRQKEIENLTPVLLNVESPLVLAIDAPWGAGKTTFIKLWQRYLESENKVSLYINCWENDFVDDPLLPMLSAMDGWLSTEKGASANAWDKAKKLTPGLLKAAAVAATKAGTFGALDLEREYEKILSDAAGGVVSDLVDNFNAKKKVVNQFKALIAQAMDGLPDEQQNLIIFVDELDRCRPTYAIEVLERMKHLFDIERVVFVIGINRKQLSKSLQGVYGPAFDGDHYLKRFIDLDYHLTVPDQIGYINTRFNQRDINDYFATRRDGQTDLETIKRVIKGLIQSFDYQLRDIDQLIMRFRLILKSIPSDHYLDEVVLCSLLILREQNNDLYQRFRNDEIYVNEVIKYLIGEPDVAFLPDYYSLVGGCLLYASRNYYNPGPLKPMIDYWEKVLDSFEEDSKNHRIIRHLLAIANSSSAGQDPENFRLFSFDRIELVNQISLSSD